MGDYNINLLNYDVHNNTAEFTDMMYANSFIPRYTPDQNYSVICYANW